MMKIIPNVCGFHLMGLSLMRAQQRLPWMSDLSMQYKKLKITAFLTNNEYFFVLMFSILFTVFP